MKTQRIPGRQKRRKCGIRRVGAKDLAGEIETRAQSILEAVQAGILIIDPETHTIAYANPAAVRLIGAAREQIIGKICHNFVCPAEAGQCPITDLGQEVDNSERILLTAAGKRVPVLKTVAPIALGGRRYLLESFIDISWRKEAEAELLEKSEELNRYFHNSLDMLCIADTAGRFLRLNPEWEKVLGYSLAELEGRSFLDLVHPEDLKNTLAAISRLESQEEVRSFENRYRCKDGSYRWIEWRSRPQGDRIYAIARDITKRKLAQEELKRSREQFELAVRGSRDGIWDWNLRDNSLYLSPRWKQIIGYEDAGFPNVFASFVEHIHPEDKPRVLEFVDRYLKGQVKEYNIEFRLRHRDGTFRWMLARGEALRDQKGIPYRMAGSHTDITERKRAEEALLQQSQLQKLLMDTSSRFINIPLAKVEPAIRASLRELAGFVGADRAYIFEYNFNRQTCSNTHEWCREGIAPQVEKLQDVPLSDIPEWVAAHRKGEPMYIPDVAALPGGHLGDILKPQGILSLLAIPMMEERDCIGFVGFDSVRLRHAYTGMEQQLLTVFARVLVNVKLRKKTESELAWRTTLLLALLDSIPDLVFFKDKNGIYLGCNPEFAKFVGKKREEIIGHMDYDLFPRAVAEAFKDNDRQMMLEGKPRHNEEWVTYPDGQRVLLDTLKAPLINLRGAAIGILGVSRDMTLRKQAEEAMREAKDAADIANRAKSAFLANMSHEIRTPMNAILGFSDILASQVENPAHREYLASISASGKLLLNLINDIIDLSKIESGKLKLEYTAVSPHRLFNEIGQIFSEELRRKGLAFSVHIDTEMPEALVLDEIRLRQVILNLVGNAVKFTPAGGITLSASKRYVRPDRSAIEFVFSVADTGIGIAPDQQDLIFEAFQQQTGQSHAQYGGTGLGLAICRRLVEAMGGQVAVMSAPGKGSTFQVVLGNVSVAATKPAAGTQKDEISTVAFAPARILIVDDDRVNRLLLTRYLGDPAFTIEEAENGRELLESARRQRPDLVLLDMRMPVMDGGQALQNLKADPALASIPVIIISASAMPEEKKAAMALGCDGYLTKPVRKHDLLREMARLLAHAGVAPAASTAQDVSRFMAGAPAAARSRWPELAALLREETRTGWKQVSGIMHINRIRAFAERIGSLGRQYGMEPLASWAATLKQQADAFDIEHLKLSLQSFPGLVDEIAALAGQASEGKERPAVPGQGELP
ncbi:MAG: PAS domain S-box protein [Kiritimatiellia bacterium]